MKAPAAAMALPNLTERARQEEWSDVRFAEALLFTEVGARESHGGEGRITTARFPPQVLGGVRLHFQRSVKKTLIAL